MNTIERLETIRKNIEGYDTKRPLSKLSPELDARIDRVLNMQLQTTHDIEVAKAFIPLLNETLFRLRYYWFFRVCANLYRLLARGAQRVYVWANYRADNV